MNGTLPLEYDGPFGVPEYGTFWNDGDEFYKSGQLTAIELSYVSTKISAIRAR